MRNTFCKKYNVGDVIKLNGSGIIVTIERIDNDGYYRGGIWCFSDLDVQCKIVIKNLFYGVKL